MNILSITAGAAGMYCGSCLRDNALAAELKLQGHEVTLLPLYSPIKTDEEDVSEKRVFFGGISVFLQQNVPIFRKTPWILDRIWDSPFLIKLASFFAVSTDPSFLGEMTLSMLRGEEGHQSKEILKLVDWLKKQVKPEIVTLPNSLLIALARPLKSLLGCPVLCTLQGEDLFLDGLKKKDREKAVELIRLNESSVDGYIAVSRYYAKYMKHYLGLQKRIEVVPLGIRYEDFKNRRTVGNTVPKIGFLARIAPEKGLHNLCAAYRILRQRGTLKSGRLLAAGYLGSENRNYLAGLEKQMSDWGLEGEFQYEGVLNHREKIEFLRGLDVFSVPSRYHEPKGLYLLEAMACGVPTVQPGHGAFPEIIEKTGGGILVDSEDPESVADGIASLLEDRTLANELGRRGARGVRELYSVQREALRSIEVYQSFIQMMN